MVDKYKYYPEKTELTQSYGTFALSVKIKDEVIYEQWFTEQREALLVFKTINDFIKEIGQQNCFIMKEVKRN